MVEINKIYQGNTLEVLKGFESNVFDTIITSPPYWPLRSYGECAKVKWGDGWFGQLGLEHSLDLFLVHLWLIADELFRVLKPTGVMFWNMGDCYGGTNSRCSFGGRAGFEGVREGTFRHEGVLVKSLAMQNYRFSLGLLDVDYRNLVEWRAQGKKDKFESCKEEKTNVLLRNIVTWYKVNHMPGPFQDRLVNSSEPIFMLVKSKNYFFDLEKLKEVKKLNGLEGFDREGNPGDMWSVPLEALREEHFAAFPKKLVLAMLLLGNPDRVCKKCSNVSGRMFEVNRVNGPMSSRKIAMINNLSKSSVFRTNAITTRKFTGYKDCECGVGFGQGIVLDPFMGSGTVGLVAKGLQKKYVGIEINPKYIEIAEKRISEVNTIFDF